MIEIYSKLYRLLDAHGKRRVALVALVMLIAAGWEVVGVVSIMPFVAVVANPESIQSNDRLRWAHELTGRPETQTFLFWLGIAVFIIVVSSILFRAFSYVVQTRFANRQNHAISCRLFAGFLNQPYEWFLAQHSADLSAKILQEVNQVVNGALFPAIQILANGLIVVFLLTLLVIADPQLAALISVTLSVGYGGVILVSRKYLTRIGDARKLANRWRFKIVRDTLFGVKDVKLLGIERASLIRYQGPSSELARYATSAKIVGEVPSYAMQAFVFGGMLLVLLYLMARTGSFQEALPVISLYAFAVYRMMPSMQTVYRNFSSLQFSMPTVDSLHEDLANVEDVALSVPNDVPLGLRERLELRGVDYRYPSAEESSLKELSMTIEAHTTIGLVGKTGSGKTTCVDVILGLLRPTMGQLIVDGNEVTENQRRSWQRSIGYVPQEIFLVDATVTANIAFGVPPENVDSDAVERAARIANLHDFVIEELEEGYSTMLGDRGIRLSGGQRQRIGIARALYRDPDVLVLDEATSALDNVTEKAVVDAVHNIGRQKTVLMIAHRLSTVRECDEIFVLHDGAVVSSGTYDELMTESEQFRTLAGLDESASLQAASAEA